MKKVMLLVALLAGFLSSCGDDEVVLDPAKTGYDYYPLTVGEFREYKVSETKYANNVPTVVTFETRELINGVSKDQTGRDWYRVEVSRRATAADAWTVQGVKLISASNTDLQIQENNKTNVHMVFPVKTGKSWIYNAFTDQANPEPYFYEAVGEPLEINDARYDNTAVLVKTKGDVEDIVDFKDEFEVLAKGLGPVYRSLKDFRYCDNTNPDSPCQIGEGYIVSGTERTEVLQSHGVID